MRMPLLDKIAPVVGRLVRLDQSDCGGKNDGALD